MLTHASEESGRSLHESNLWMKEVVIYYQALRAFRKLSGKAFPSVSNWANRELIDAHSSRAAMLDRRLNNSVADGSAVQNSQIAHSLDLNVEFTTPDAKTLYDKLDAWRCRAQGGTGIVTLRALAMSSSFLTLCFASRHSYRGFHGGFVQQRDGRARRRTIEEPTESPRNHDARSRRVQPKDSAG